MLTNLASLAQSLTMFSVLLGVQICLLLLLRKPVRTWFGAVACYRLWLLLPLWLPFYVFGNTLLHWLANLRPGNPAPTELHDNNAPLFIQDWLLPLKLDLTKVPDVANGSDHSASLWAALALVWLLGTVVLLVWQALKLAAFSSFVNSTAELVQDDELAATGVLSHFGDEVQSLYLRGIGSAALFGIFHPMLLLPESFTARYDSDQRHIILAHEAVHLRRKDNCWNLGASLLLALWWTNPLVFLAWRYYRLDQELSCDALALKRCNKTQQKRYAMTLLDSLGSLNSSGMQPALSAWDNLRHLKERSLMVKEHLKTSSRPFSIALGLFMLAIAGANLTMIFVAFTSPATLAAEPDKNESATPHVLKTDAQVTDQGQKKAVVITVKDDKQSESSTTRGKRQVSKEVGTKMTNIFTLLSDNKFDDALAELQQLQKQSEQGQLTDYESSRMWQMIFTVQFQKGNYPDAAAAMEKFLQFHDMADVERMEALWQIGQVYMQQENWQKGLDYLLKAKDMGIGSSPSRLYLIAVSYSQLKQNEKAIPYLEQAIAASKNKPRRDFYKLLAECYRQTGQLDKAKLMDEKIKEIAPSTGQVQDLVPSVRVSPAYPQDALARKQEGSVKVRFNISQTGTVTDAVVVESEPRDVFDEAALIAVSRWRYRPQVEAGAAVERRGVETSLRFQLQTPDQ